MAKSKDKRCSWCLGSELYIDYHDNEWGVPCYDARALFEMLSLEGAQAGLSWITILNKRENYRRLFANFDAAKSAALAICMLDWREHGAEYAEKMISVAKALAQSLAERGVPVYAEEFGYTQSHQFAVKAAKYGGGQTVSRKLRQGGFLTCGIGLPIPEVPGDLNGLRIGTPEIVRFGVTEDHTDGLAELIKRTLDSENPAEVAAETRALRAQFQKRHYLYSE